MPPRPLWAAPQTVVFGANGQLASINGAAVGAGTTSLAITTVPSNYTWTGAAPQIDFPPTGSENAVTQFASDQTIAVTSQDGYAAGTLDSYSIGANGSITGTYSNGQSQTLGTIALAQFANPQGLDDVGNGDYTPDGGLGQPPARASPGPDGLGHPAGRRGGGLECRPGHRADRPD